MTITVKSCSGCLMHEGMYFCRKNIDMNVFEYAFQGTTHPDCPLRTEKITVELEDQPEPTTTNQSGN